LYDGYKVLALEFILSVLGLRIEGAEVGESFREKRMQGFYGRGGGELVEDHVIKRKR
jgi:hypothetical protein